MAGATIPSKSTTTWREALLKQAATSLGFPVRAFRPGVSLVVWRDRLDAVVGAGRRRVHGLYDRTLNRIEVFGCDADARDATLVRVLAHELAHASGVTDEQAARSAAARAISRLDEVAVAAFAAALRAAAQTRITHALSNLSFSPLSGMGE